LATTSWSDGDYYYHQNAGDYGLPPQDGGSGRAGGDLHGDSGGDRRDEAAADLREHRAEGLLFELDDVDVGRSRKSRKHALDIVLSLLSPDSFTTFSSPLSESTIMTSIYLMMPVSNSSLEFSDLRKLCGVISSVSGQWSTQEGAE
jgi:hypothetical protein